VEREKTVTDLAWVVARRGRVGCGAENQARSWRSGLNGWRGWIAAMAGEEEGEEEDVVGGAEVGILKVGGQGALDNQDGGMAALDNWCENNYIWVDDQKMPKVNAAVPMVWREGKGVDVVGEVCLSLLAEKWLVVGVWTD
jgi:hypothetical protein